MYFSLSKFVFLLYDISKMTKSAKELKVAAERGAVSTIAREAKKSNLPWEFFKQLLVRAIGVQAQLIDRQVTSDGSNTSAVQKMESLAAKLTFGANIKRSIDEYLED